MDMELANSVVLDSVRLNVLRLRKGLLRGELAAVAGINATSCSHALNRKPVGVLVARKLAKAVGVELDELIAAPQRGGVKSEIAEARATG